MQLDDMEITSFSVNKSNKLTPASRRYERVNGSHRRVRTRAGGMLAKIGFCIAVLAAAILVQNFLLTDTNTRNALEASAEGNSQAESEESEDVLGRLRFVESGGVKSVFAVSQRWSMPAESLRAVMVEDDTLLAITGKAGDTVRVSAAGEVRAIASDTRLGDYVRVHHGSDLESVYYNVNNIRVEIGQPLLAGDTLGNIGETGQLYVAISQSGVPQLPSAYLEVTE